MKRLVYNPRAYVFVKDVKGKVHDLSPYVTAGNVVRKIDQVSTAEVTIRNPEMKWTAHRDGDNIVLPTFSPMDPITIYLRRMPGHPVRVFTGFLDQTPYLQLFPGKVTLKASCTLKRLLYTYFDPALPYTQSFLREYGWVEMENGVWGSFAGLDTYKPPDPLAPLPNGIQAQASGSISELLGATLQYIGNWNKNSIYIEKIPDGIFPRLAELATEFQDEQKGAKKAYEDLFKKIVGASSVGNAVTAGGNTHPAGGGTEVQASVFAPGDAGGQFAGAGTKFPGGQIPGGSPPPAGMYYAELSTPAGSGSFDALGRILGKGKNDQYGGLDFGTPLRITYKDKSVIARKADRGNGGPSQPKIDLWYTVAQALGFQGLGKVHIEILTEKQVKDLEDSGGANFGSDSRKNAASASSVNTTDRSSRQGGSNKTTSTGGNSGGEWAYPLSKDVGNGAGGVAGHMSRPLDNWESDNAVDLMAPPGTKWIAVEDGVISPPSYPGWGESSGGPTVYGYRLHLVGDSGNVYFYQHGASNIAPRNKKVKKGDIIGQVGDYSSNGIPNHLHFAAKPPLSPETVTAGGKITAGGADSTTSPPTAGDASQSQPDSGGAAALFATLDLPGALDTVAAQMLSGEKSLMNDKPLMPFVQQLCNASLRHFQSMPDGKFFAFYPDYFGEFNQHPPYWEIDDIEIIDGGVDLSDDALVTHSYVVGDTASPTIGAGAPFYQRAVFSAGVVTIFNAFLNEDMLTKLDHPDQKKGSKKKDANTQDPPKGLGISLEAAEAQAFLTRYGARPLTEDMPFIKSNFYEMFLAYQKFLLGWSRQFLTPFMFTFMPEVYPGGKVGFPQHDLQMYIEEVNHSWDLESGFTTRAALSAPSVYKTKDGKQALGLLPPNMVKGLIEPVSKSRASDAPDKPMSVPAPQVDPASNPTFAPVPTAPIPGQSTGGFLAPD